MSKAYKGSSILSWQLLITFIKKDIEHLHILMNFSSDKNNKL